MYSMEASLHKRLKETTSLAQEFPIFLQIRRFQNGNEASYIVDGVTSDGDSYTLTIAKLKATDQFYPYFAMKTCTNKRMRLYENYPVITNEFEVISIGLAAEYWKESKQLFQRQEAKAIRSNHLKQKKWVKKKHQRGI